jgi:predicted membrane channel-forming protein YqfA (hemolysin III family)
MLLVIILNLWQYDSVRGQVHTAIFALGFNLICFMISALCHSMLDSEKRLPNLLFRLDHAGIIAHIWATSISVLLLEANEEWVSWYILISTTIGALLSAIYLAVVPVKKEERVIPKVLHMIGFDTQRCAIERTLLTESFLTPTSASGW